MLRYASFLLFFTCTFAVADDAVIQRYKEILIKSPKRGATFDRVYGHYVDAGQSAVLYQDCRKATEDKPTDAANWILLGLVAERRNQGEQAVKAFQTAAELEPTYHLPALYLGELLLHQRRTHEAIVAFEQADERLQNNSGTRNDRRTVLQALALAYERFGNSQKSAEMWNQLADLFPNDPDILVQVAESMELEGKLEEALKQYRQLIRITDEPAERVRLSLAAIDIMLRQGNDTQALDDLDLLLGFLDTESYLADSVRDRVDRIFGRANDPTRQIEFYQKRIEQEPNDIASLLRLVKTLQKTDKTADAEKLLLDTIKNAPANVSLRLTLIDLLAERKDIDGAIEQFQALDKIVPNHADYLIRWGTLLLQNPAMTESVRRTEAANVWSRIAVKAANDPVTLVQVADLFTRNRFFTEAERYYNDALTLRPNDFAYREYLAMFYHQQRRKEKVLEALPSTLRNKAEAGQLLLTMEYFAEASEMLREAVQSSPQDWMLQYRYLESLVRQGNFAEAAKLIVEAEKKIRDDEQYTLFLHQEIQLLRATQRLAEAIRVVQSNLEASPSVRTHWHLAALHQGGANFSAAIAAIERAINDVGVSPTTSAALLRFAAELYEQSGNTTKAIALYQKLVQDDPPRGSNYWQQIITLQIQRGELSHALESSQKLLGRGIENAERLRFVAELFLSINRRAEAMKLLQQALVHEPGNTDVLRILAQTFSDANQHEEAIELLWRLYSRLEHLPAKLSVIDMLVNEYNKLDRRDDLVEQLRQLSRNFDRRREAMQALARVFVLDDELDEAQYMLETLLDFPDDKDDPEVTSLWTLRELVTLSEKKKDLASAIRYQETICQKFPADLREQDTLFRLYYKVGDTAKTKRLLLDQVLRHSGLQERLEIIDAMIQQEDFESTSLILDFLEMHEPEQWEFRFRRILVDAHQGKPVENLVKAFRAKRFHETPSVPQEKQGDRSSLIGSLTAPDELIVSFEVQHKFLLALFHQDICKSGRAPEQRPVVDISYVQTLQDARVLVLGWLLRDALLKDIGTRGGNPTVMRQFRNTIEELRDMLPLDSAKHEVLMERLRLEEWLLYFRISYDLAFYVLNENDPAKSRLQIQIDERTCQQTIWQIVRKLALDDVADWQPALFQILTAECINELVAERFKEVSDAERTEKLSQIFNSLCEERKISPTPADAMSGILTQAASLVNASITDHRASQRLNFMALSQKTDRLLSIWKEFIEEASPEIRTKYSPSFAARYNTLLWILRSQNREEDAKNLELSLQKTAQSHPLWFAENINSLTYPTSEDLKLFDIITRHNSLEVQFSRIKTAAVEILPFCTDKEDKRALCEILFRQSHDLLHPWWLYRYDIFTPSERQLFGLSSTQLWNDLHVPSVSQQGRLARQLFGVDPPVATQVQILDADQRSRLTELDKSLQQMTDFAFWVLHELKLELEDISPTDAIVQTEQRVALTRYRLELQGERPVDRTMIYSLVQYLGAANSSSAVNQLFCRILLLRRALDTKKQFLRVRIDEQIMPIQDNYTEEFAKLLTSKKGSSSAIERTWGAHFLETFGDMLKMGEQSVERPAAPGLDADLSRIVWKLESKLRPLSAPEEVREENPAEGIVTPTEKMALALLYTRMQQWEDVVKMLDIMELSTTELWLREWIIANVAMRKAMPDSALRQRGSEAAKRLMDFRLAPNDSLKLVVVLQYFEHNEEAQKVLDYLTATVSEHRLLTELFYKMNATGESQKENAAKTAQRILLNPTFLQNARRLTSDVYLMEETVKTLKKQNRLDTVMPMLENRLKGHRDKTDSRILLAKLYIQLDRRDEAKALVFELAQNPTAEPERRQMVVSLLVGFDMSKELEAMNRLLLERR
jgi:tetratricopeptide (TPR) repeat protein